MFLQEVAEEAESLKKGETMKPRKQETSVGDSIEFTEGNELLTVVQRQGRRARCEFS
jgi:hypothetical protein